MIKKKLLVGVVFAMVLSPISMNKMASAGEIAVAITGAEFVTIAGFGISDFGDVTLNGSVLSTTATISTMTIVDARGTGAGWSVNVKATPFTSNTSNNIGLIVLPDNSLALGTVSITAGNGSSDVSGTTITQGTIDNSAGVKILSSAINSGMGTYTVNIGAMTLTLSPKDAEAGSYSSTITMLLSQGP